MNTTELNDWRDVRDAGGIFYISHSGGKDSSAMYCHLKYDLNIPSEQIVVVHAHLGEAEWRGVPDYIQESISEELKVVEPIDCNGNVKTFISMVKNRGKWPSPSCRQCTSDLKRGPIDKLIRHDLKAKGLKIGINCMGLRADESPARRKKETWKLNKRLSIAGRQIFDWLPIHDWSTDQVFDRIYAASLKPFHAYGERGEKNERLSCVFCIMGSKNDHRHGAYARPGLYKTLVDMEIEMNFTMFPGVGLEQRNNLTVEQAQNGIK